MATGTLIFRPTSDISIAHNLSSGSDGYRMIADTTADDNSTYLSQALTSSTSSTINSNFNLTITTGTLPVYDYKITEVRLYSRAMGSTNNASGSYTCTFTIDSTTDTTSEELKSGSYATVTTTSANLTTAFNNAILLNQTIPEITVQVSTTGAKSSSKNSSDGYIRVTQVYMEVDYEETVFEPIDEEPGVTYYSVTISSINATTNPENGTIRLTQGSNQTIEIFPTDPVISRATDNGIDITNQLTMETYNHTYTITEQVSGASYGFTLNSNNYYESTNKARANSAAVSRINFNFDSECAVTIQYINYAEATYDYGLIGAIDIALSTDSTADSSAAYRFNTNAQNSNTAQTVTIRVPAGNHFVDIKYRKDNATNSNNDTLQWKISNLEVLGGTAKYTYNLTNITEKHNIIFAFGDATYYTITSTGNNCRIFPDGEVIVMPGNSYIVNIVPNIITDVIEIMDNGTNMTSSLIKEKGINSNGQTIVSYSYSLSNVQENHNLSIIDTKGSILYNKISEEWKPILDVYYKENGIWVKKDLSFFQNMDLTYIKKGV